MKKFVMFKFFSFKHIKSNSKFKINKNKNVLFCLSHLKEHVSNFGAVSTQIRVTLWKEDNLYKNKDKQYPMILMRPEDR